MQGIDSNNQTVTIYNSNDPAATLQTGMQLLVNTYGTKDQPKIVTQALPRPVTVVDLEGELACELADRRVLKKQIQELTVQLTKKDKRITQKADALNVERRHFGLPVKARTGAEYGIDSFRFSTIGEKLTAGQSAPALDLTFAPSQHKVRGNILFDPM